jgi:hypothetical protein
MQGNTIPLPQPSLAEKIEASKIELKLEGGLIYIKEKSEEDWTPVTDSNT